ncbi:MAG: hypothetical protein LPK19_13460, partial [Hymenobacteraceae bacterium]|nr:hypothetical protein [Hymenobacteraceae bacterium]MDX5397235.1 hypothetical protein [Hymenobacteraceae bacterium]MDX5513311.1 hypothetical protein [Hymenobacteraceae bacterium]
GTLPAPSTQNLAYNASGCSAGGNLTVNLQNNYPANPYCASVTSSCTSGSPGMPDYEIHNYFGTLTLPVACDNWRVSFRSSDWNNNVNLAPSNFLYNDAMIDNVNAADNSSPVFTNDPLIFMLPTANTYNKSYTYNLGAVELDGDSLAYSITSALTDYNQPAVYNVNYSGTNPFGQNNGSVTIDAASGAMQIGVLNANAGPPSAYPNNYVVAVQIEEYRKNTAGTYQKIGHIRRDLNMMVLNGNSNHLPELQPISVNGNPESYNTIIEVEAGQQTTISFSATDNDPGSLVGLGTNAGQYFQNALFSFSGSPGAPTGTLTFTPTLAQVRQYPYYITFITTDNACPLRGVQIKTLGLRVKASGTVGVKEDLAKKYQLPTLLNKHLNSRLMLHAELEGATVSIYNHTGSLVKKIENYRNNWSAAGVAAGLYLYSVEQKGLSQPINSKLLIVN